MGGDLATAETYFRAVLELGTESPDALRGMMDLLIRSDNHFQARAFWQRLERTGAVQAEDLLMCYIIESEQNFAPAARDCADRLRREFSGTAAVRQLRTLEQDGN
jgi:type IV pilus assembly protein PilF